MSPFCMCTKSNYSICFLYVNDLKMTNKGCDMLS